MKNGVIKAVAVATSLAATGLIVSTQMNLNDMTNRYEKLEKEHVEVIKDRNKIKEVHKELEIKFNKEIDEKNKEIEELKDEKTNLEKKLEQSKSPRQVSGKARSGGKEVHFELTYYTNLPQENGGYTITSSQTPLRHGVVASNHYPVGTKIEINGQIYTVEDTGGSEFNSPNRLDVLVERHAGESDQEYLNRVNNKGRTQVKGTIL